MKNPSISRSSRANANSIFRNRSNGNNFSYETLEPRQLLTADLLSSTEIINGGYYLNNAEQEFAARNFLATDAETSYLSQGANQLRLIDIKHGLASTVTRFQQTLHGIPIAGAYAITIQNSFGDFVQVHNQGTQLEMVARKNNHVISFEQAEKAALNFAGATSTFAASRGELVWLEGEDGKAHQAFEITVFGVNSETHGDFYTLVDPVTSKVISQENRISNFENGAGKVFYPNPYQTQGSGTGLTDANDINSTALTNQLIDVTLQGLDEGTGLIKGEFVNLSTLNSSTITDVDANEASRIYNYNRDDWRFEQVVIYHTVDQLNRYFHALGFDDSNTTPNGIRDFPTLANAHWDNADNSFYSTGDDAIHFGDGGVDDAEDGDIIVHEYGHAVQHDQNSLFSGGETGAMGEGFGDYLAASFFQTVGNATFQASHAAAVGEWDATSYSSDNPPNLRRVDGNKLYPSGGVSGEVHDDGEIWSRALWDMKQSLGSIADKLILESHFLLPAAATMPQAALAILQADVNIYGGTHEAAIRAAFEARQILQPPPGMGTVAFGRGFYQIGDTINLAVVDGNAATTIQVTLATTGGDAETLTLTNSAGTYTGTINAVAGSPTANDNQLQVALGQTVTVTYQDANNGSGNTNTVTDTATIATVIRYDSTNVPINIPDNTTITSTISIAGNYTILDVDLQLNITHTWDGDLIASVKSPANTSVTLFSRIGGSGDNFTNTYFDSEATTPIGSGTAPYTGNFQPAGSLTVYNDAINAGNWVLTISDNANLDTGTLNAWSLIMAVLPNNTVIGPVGDANLAANSVAENAAVGATVGVTASATDPDVGDTVSYSLTNNAGGLFAINSTSGVVTVAAALDFETAASHIIDVRAASTDGSHSDASFTINVTNVNDAIVSNGLLIYKGSSFDSGGTTALATGKEVLRNGIKAQFKNYSSYWKGINSLVVEVNDLNQVPTLGTFADFFTFNVGNSDNTFTWSAAPNPTGLVYLSNVNASGKDQVILTWADNVIQNQWLQVTTLDNPTTGLNAPDVFYYGNAIGESGNDSSNAQVNLADIAGTRSNQSGFGTVGIENNFDFNRDRFVNLQDISIARTNQSGFTPLLLITPTGLESKNSGSGGKGGNTSAELQFFASNNLSPSGLMTANLGSTSKDQLNRTLLTDTTTLSSPMSLAGNVALSPSQQTNVDRTDGSLAVGKTKQVSIDKTLIDNVFNEFEFFV